MKCIDHIADHDINFFPGILLRIMVEFKECCIGIWMLQLIIMLVNDFQLGNHAELPGSTYNLFLIKSSLYRIFKIE